MVGEKAALNLLANGHCKICSTAGYESASRDDSLLSMSGISGPCPKSERQRERRKSAATLSLFVGFRRALLACGNVEGTNRVPTFLLKSDVRDRGKLLAKARILE